MDANLVMTMTHPGLSPQWGVALWFVIFTLSFLTIFLPLADDRTRGFLNLKNIPLLGRPIAGVIGYITHHVWVLFIFKLIFAGVFLVIIAAGLFGSPYPERNAATVLTWNLWWTGLVISIFFLGSIWCALCPWNSLANWMVNRKFWQRATEATSLGLRVPKYLKTIWPAFFLLLGLTWLELGVGIVLDPFATSVLALAILVMAVASLATFERNAFCHYFCPVGRTVGFYAQLAPVELRPIDEDKCAGCTTLECYHGSTTVDPCPTHLVMGRLQQNTYCTSCGNCARSCPHDNVAWRLRSPSAEAISDARPHWDEAWFMIGLLALTGFHGLTMMSFWEEGMYIFARKIGDSGQMLTAFSFTFALALAAPICFYLYIIKLVHIVERGRARYSELFCRFSFIALPLAFSYHLAHNLNHLLREGRGFGELMLNPLGIGRDPAGMDEKSIAMMDQLVSPEVLQTIQVMLLAGGFAIAMQIIRTRAKSLEQNGPIRTRIRASILVFFAMAMTGYHLWLLMQPMVMRM